MKFIWKVRFQIMESSHANNRVLQQKQEDHLKN